MTNKKIYFFVGLIIVCVLISSTFVSASWFSDLWHKIVGKQVQLGPVGSCYDSDGGKNPDIPGIASGYNSANTYFNKTPDVCKDAYSIYEYYCTNYTGASSTLASTWPTALNCQYGCNPGTGTGAFCNPAGGGGGNVTDTTPPIVTTGSITTTRTTTSMIVTIIDSDSGWSGWCTVSGGDGGNTFTYLNSTAGNFSSIGLTCNTNYNFYFNCYDKSNNLGSIGRTIKTSNCSTTGGGGGVPINLTTTKKCTEFGYNTQKGVINYCDSNKTKYDLSVCSNVTYKCVDSDGGQNYNFFGKVTSSGSSINGPDCLGASSGSAGGSGGNDTCKDSLVLKEYVCTSSNLSAITEYSCPNGCLNGACVNATTQSYPEFLIEQDLGNFIYVSSGYQKETEHGITMDRYEATYGETNGNTFGVVVAKFDSVGAIELFFETELANNPAYKKMLFSEGQYVYYDDSAKVMIWTNSAKILVGITEVNLGAVPGDFDNLINLYLDKFPSNIPGDETCSKLIEIVKNPADMEINGVTYHTTWNDTWRGSQWIDGARRDYTGYYNYWYTDNAYNNEKTDININMNVQVFDDLNINMASLFEDRYFNSPYCRAMHFWGLGEEQIAYVCNYGIYSSLFLDSNELNYNDNSKSVYWFNKNVLVGMDINSYGGVLTDAELNLLASKKLTDFLASIADNHIKWISSYENFELSGLARTFVDNILNDCASTFSTTKCYPDWNCKLEPVICPEYGEQKIVCVDWDCNLPKMEQTQTCSPGICSGCYVPKWIAYDKGDNKCIPYGFRFNQDVGSWTKKLVEEIENENLPENNDDDYGLKIISDNEAIITLYAYDNDNNAIGYNTTLIKGQEVQLNLPVPFENIETAYITLNNVIYDSVKGNYIDVTIRLNQWRDTYEVYNSLNMYCDIDGQVKQQKIKEYDGSWAKCQNSYECDSNFCSGGECLELNDMIRNVGKEVSTWKLFISKILCRLGHMFSIESYEQCVANRIGIAVEPPVTSS